MKILFVSAALAFTTATFAQEYQPYWSAPAYEMSVEDSLFLDQLSNDTFNWFWEKAHSATGLSPDRSTDFSTQNSHISIASVGFGLTAYGIGAELGYVSRAQAAERVDKTLRALLLGKMGKESTGTVGYRGWYYHFLNANTLERAWTSELSSIDTALMMLGVIFVRNYFDDAENDLETAIRDSATVILDRVDWRFMRNPNTGGISGGWNPESGFINFEYAGYNEAMLLYILALGGTTNPVPTSAWQFWTSRYRYETTAHFPIAFVTFAPLFGHHYPHAWIDFRGLHNDELDLFGEKYDYFENARRATYANRAYCAANPEDWPNYSESEWGLTACDGPRNFGFNGYRARGASGNRIVDDGTIAPTAAGGSIAYAPEIVIPMLRNLKEKYGSKLYSTYGFRDAYNDSVNWFDTDYIGIDQGPILMMIENYRSGWVWEVMKKDSIIQKGLIRAGFAGGWIDDIVVNVEDPEAPPKRFILWQNYPNPFNPNTTIQFELAEASMVTLSIYNTVGQLVRTLIPSRRFGTGAHKVAWDARDDTGKHVAGGLYFYKIKAGQHFTAQRKLILMK